MIRHAPEPAACPVGPVPVAVIVPSLRAFLVFPLGGPNLLPARFLPAAETAVFVAPVTMTADPEHPATVDPPAKPLTQWFFMDSHHRASDGPEPPRRNMTFMYDAAGNQKTDGTHNYTFNAVNQITQMDAGAAVYAYDGDGRRMKKTVGTEMTYYFYAVGVLVSEFSTTNTSATGAASTDQTTYQTSDKPGTAVLLMAASGLVIENNRTLPYGEEWLPSTASANEQKFTSYQRDAESGLDYALNRYASTRNGRFQSVDKGPYLFSTPVSLNRYAMTLADPVNYTDQDGMAPQSNDPPPYDAFASFLDWLLTRRLQSLLTGEIYGLFDFQSAEILKEGQRGHPILTHNPLPCATINQKYGDTADGRFSTLGACRELAPSKQESTTYEPSLVCKLLILSCRLLIPDRLLGAYRRTRNGEPQKHLGVDLRAPVGTEIRAAGSGNVILVPNAEGYGKKIEIYHSLSAVTYYPHLDSFSVAHRDQVAAGTIIGTVGRSGNVPAGARSHLHFEVILNNARINPADVFAFTKCD